MDSPSADTPAQRGPLPAFRAMVAAGELAPDASQELRGPAASGAVARLRGYDPPPAPANGISLFARLLRREPPPEPAARALHRGRGRPRQVHADGPVLRRAPMCAASSASISTASCRTSMRASMPASAPIPTIDDPIPPLADSIAADAALLCFDEFQVNDIADAMILGRLFQALFDRGVVVVATSNIAPDDLFKGQPGRDAFLPFIALIKQRLDVVMMDAGRDFRRERMRGMRDLAWCRPMARADRELDRAFAELTGGAEAQAETLTGDGPQAASCRWRPRAWRAAISTRCAAPHSAPATILRWRRISIRWFSTASRACRRTTTTGRGASSCWSIRCTISA